MSSASQVMTPIRVHAHITGPSGSGKTHVGMQLTNYTVKDIDDFLEDIPELSSSSTSQLRTTDRVFTRLIDRIRSWVSEQERISAMPIVLVGLAHVYTEHGIMHFPIEAQWRIALEIGTKALVRQFITRDLQVMCAHREQTYADILAGKFEGRWTRESIKESKEEVDRIYRARGYTLMNGKNAIEFLSRARDTLSMLSYDYYTELMPPMPATKK